MILERIAQTRGPVNRSTGQDVEACRPSIGMQARMLRCGLVLQDTVPSLLKQNVLAIFLLPEWLQLSSAAVGLGCIRRKSSRPLKVAIRQRVLES